LKAVREAAKEAQDKEKKDAPKSEDKPDDKSDKEDAAGGDAISGGSWGKAEPQAYSASYYD